MLAKSIVRQGPETNFGPKRNANGEWKMLHIEELHSLYRSDNLLSIIKSKRLKGEVM